MPGAAEQYSKAVEADPENYEAHNSLGAVLSMLGDFPRAIDHFRTAVALNDSFVEGHYNLGRALAETGGSREALAEFRKVVQLDSTYALAYLSAGSVFAAQGMSEQAIDSFERAIHFDPHLIQAHVSLASVFIGLEQYDEGINRLLEARVYQPDDPSLISMAGRMALLKRDAEQAISLFNVAADLDPENPVHRNDLATALMLAERTEDAIAEWEKALTLGPDPSLEQIVRQNLERARRE